MELDIVSLIFVGITVACAVYLLLERAVSRILAGFILMGNALNMLMMIVSGSNTKPSFYHDSPLSEQSDPLAQAMALTSIVISLATGAFMIALAYRLFIFSSSEAIEDDEEDTTEKPNMPSAAEELVDDQDDHYSSPEDPAVDRSFADDDDDPTGDLFAPLSLEDDHWEDEAYPEHTTTSTTLPTSDTPSSEEHSSVPRVDTTAPIPDLPESIVAAPLKDAEPRGVVQTLDDIDHDNSPPIAEGPSPSDPINGISQSPDPEEPGDNV